MNTKLHDTKKTIPLISLLLFSTFASFLALLPTAALPSIAQDFHVTLSQVELIMTVYLFGYAGGQLIYGPLANGWGRKNSLCMGTAVAVLGALLTVISGYLHVFGLLVAARLILALGASGGLVISMILIKDCYDPIDARRIFSKVVLASACVTFISTTISGLLTHYLGWKTTSLVGLIYAIVLICLIPTIPETVAPENRLSISIRALLQAYGQLFKNINYIKLILLYAIAGSAVYVFNGIAPLVVIKDMGVSSAAYGWLSSVPAIGFLIGGWLSGRFAHRLMAWPTIRIALGIILISSVVLSILFGIHVLSVTGFYAVAIVLFIGIAALTPSASMEALAQVSDHANGAAVMNTFTFLCCSFLVGVTSKGLEFSILAFPIMLVILAVVGLLLASGSRRAIK